jgi:hypothetical protein
MNSPKKKTYPAKNLKFKKFSSKVSYKLFTFFFLLLILISSSCRPFTKAYREQYRHLEYGHSHRPVTNFSDYYIIFLVDAHHLDYSNNDSLLKTLAKHPDDWSKSGDVGHAWIYLCGIKDGSPIIIEGGHSGELGQIQPKYFEGIMNYMEYGVLRPEQEEVYRYEPNPIKYLWETLKDGFFEVGSGGHTPTYAVKVNLTSEQFESILEYIENYNFSEYCLIDHQCTTFVTQIAALVGLDLEHQLAIPIGRTISFGKQALRLHDDCEYNWLVFSSPDILERSLIYAVQEGRAEYVKTRR